ncbi:hypothetical protein AS032_14660 [Rhodococcus qingshengii]|nr:hypothetical protein AS032_14660 [Rhodococcus qingshengii]
MMSANYYKARADNRERLVETYGLSYAEIGYLDALSGAIVKMIYDDIDEARKRTFVEVDGNIARTFVQLDVSVLEAVARSGNLRLWRKSLEALERAGTLRITERGADVDWSFQTSADQLIEHRARDAERQSRRRGSAQPKAKGDSPVTRDNHVTKPPVTRDTLLDRELENPLKDSVGLYGQVPKDSAGASLSPGRDRAQPDSAPLTSAPSKALRPTEHF